MLRSLITSLFILVFIYVNCAFSEDISHKALMELYSAGELEEVLKQIDDLVSRLMPKDGNGPEEESKFRGQGAKWEERDQLAEKIVGNAGWDYSLGVHVNYSAERPEKFPWKIYEESEYQGMKTTDLNDSEPPLNFGNSFQSELMKWRMELKGDEFKSTKAWAEYLRQFESFTGTRTFKLSQRDSELPLSYLGKLWRRREIEGIELPKGVISGELYREQYCKRVTRNPGWTEKSVKLDEIRFSNVFCSSQTWAGIPNFAKTLVEDGYITTVDSIDAVVLGIVPEGLMVLEVRSVTSLANLCDYRINIYHIVLGHLVSTTDESGVKKTPGYKLNEPGVDGTIYTGYYPEWPVDVALTKGEENSELREKLLQADETLAAVRELRKENTPLRLKGLKGSSKLRIRKKPNW